MKQASPVHFAAGLFQPIAPTLQRMRPHTQRCSILGVPRTAEVHRLCMHALERLKSQRTASVRLRRDILGLFDGPLKAAVPAFSGAISSNLLPTTRLVSPCALALAASQSRCSARMVNNHPS